jgi:protoporphyrin/coproporphyrin ferrochelatase
VTGSTAVLVMAYGSPAGPGELEAYYTHIRRGRRPPPPLLAELRARYEAIGGRSPLLEITRAQASALRAALRGAGHGDVEVAVGMKHAPPFLEDAAQQLARSGAEHVVGLVLAPHYSRMSVQEYGDRVQAALAGGPRFTLVRSWATEPGYVRYLATAVRDALAALGPAAAGAEVLFTAHSLPERILGAGDPYPDELRATAEAVAGAAGLERWRIAWQSAGRTEERWLGPDVLEVLPRLVEAGATGVVVCPAGFVADHLEVLYDLDVEAAAEARALGLPFARTAMPNADPALAATLATAVDAHLRGAVALR